MGGNTVRDEGCSAQPIERRRLTSSGATGTLRVEDSRVLRDVGEGLVSRSLSSLIVTLYTIVAFVEGDAATGITIASITSWQDCWLPSNCPSVTRRER